MSDLVALPVGEPMTMVREIAADIRCPMYVTFKRCIQFVRVARLLHLSAFLGLCLAAGFGQHALSAIENHAVFKLFYSLCMALSGLGIIVFAQRDAWCRFQNYKLVKDLFYENRCNRSYRERIAVLFAVSKCQREAVQVAASDLGLGRELKALHQRLGYRWYHLIPDRVIENPKVILTQRYWKKTLFVLPYQSRYFLW